MLFVADIGNSQTNMAWFKGDELVARYSEPTVSQRGLGQAMRAGLKENHIDRTDVHGACVASVVPKVEKGFFYFLKAEYRCEPLMVNSSVELGLTIRYEPPEDVGADRLANAVAGKELVGLPLIVGDFGTATTLDVVSAEGEYLGGAIFPGLEMGRQMLHEKTAKLPLVNMEAPPATIGKSTEQSIQSGLLWGSVGAARELAVRMQKELGSGSHLVATGGMAPLIQDLSKFFHMVDADLALKGLRLIFLKNRPPV